MGRPFKKKTMEEVFKEVNRKAVKLNPKHRKCNNEILKLVLTELLTKMKSNLLFANMNPRLEYLGSYFDGLRVGQPTEYDINLILRIPVNYKKINLDATKTEFDHTNIFMPSEFRRLSKTPETANKGFLTTSVWCDNQYRLSVTKFRSWMQSVVDAAIATLDLIVDQRYLTVKGRSYPISAKISGPANTLNIIIGKNEVIDIDLVPTFEFALPKKPVNSKVEFSKIEQTKIKQYFVVPKPTGDDYSWRLTFPLQERYYMKDKNNFKSTIKLMKKLRDVQEFKQLCSYFIKTVGLWEIKNTNEEFWKKNSLTFLVLHMMKRLRDCLAKGCIKNFWCPEFNLMYQKIKTETCENWSNRLTFMINDLEKNQDINPKVVFDYFMSREDMKELKKDEVMEVDDENGLVMEQ